MELSEDAAARYRQSTPGEAQRARGWLGHARLLQELKRTLPSHGHIADVGGGTGDISERLLGDGYEVSLSDIVPEVAQRAAERFDGRDVAVAVASVTKLPYATNTFDAVLALGPLYHLRHRNDRVRALRELARVAKPSAPIIVEFVGARSFALWAATLALDDPEGLQAAADIDEGGWFAGSSRAFSACQTHTVKHFEEEVRQSAALSVERICALEGPFWTAATRLNNKERAAAAALFDIANRESTHTAIIETSPHCLAILTAAEERHRSSSAEWSQLGDEGLSRTN